MNDCRLILGDCLNVLPTLEPGSVDAVVTDPPYGLEFMGKEWDRLDSGLPQEAVWKGRREQGGSSVGDDDSQPSRRSHVSYGVKQHGFERCKKCGKRSFSGSPCECPEPEWVTEYSQAAPSAAIRMQRWHEEWARTVYPALRPGGYLLSFGGTRTWHRLACALEDAGFEMRDTLCWLYGTGFPKGKGCLKPAFEPVLLCRKPGPKVLPLNIDRCRVEATAADPNVRVTSSRRTKPNGAVGSCLGFKPVEDAGTGSEWATAGRWPANVVHDGGEEVTEAFAEKDHRDGTADNRRGGNGQGYMKGWNGMEEPGATYGDTGTAARFFYCAKASRAEREAGLNELPEVEAGIGDERPSGQSMQRLDGRETRRVRNTHPTVKPLALMRWLVRLVTPEGGLCLDPFLGSGTTALAALAEGCRFVGVEREAEYLTIAEKRLAAARVSLPLFAEA